MRRLALAATLASLTAQTYSPGPQVVTFFSTIDDSDQPYGLYVPNNYNPARKYPLVISLHGEGSNHRLNLRRVFGHSNRPAETDAEASRYFPKLKNVDYIVASPLARGTMGYQGIAERDVYDVLADVKQRFSVDEERVYLTGLSMGGGGALWLGLTNQGVWAAIAPVSPYPPPGIDELSGNALNVPVKLFQGEIDPLVKAESTRAWQTRFQSQGVNAEYVEYPGVRHNAWENAYRGGSIFDWFARHKRISQPLRVQFATRSYQHSSAYWVQLDRLIPGVLSKIDATFTARNRLSIITAKLNAFTLNLKDHPSVTRSLPVELTLDGMTLRSKFQPVLSLSRTPKGWQFQKRLSAGSGKRPGLEGPIADAFSRRHIYVYGTADAPQAEELEYRRATAAHAAEWSTARSRLLLTFRTVSDKELKPEEAASSNLILFGTKETNSVLAGLASQLPVALQAGAADYGLLYVYALGSRYVVINSGLPWWRRADQFTRPSSSHAPALLRPLMTFGDLIVYKGGIDNVVMESYFDPRWKLSTEVAQQLRQTGVVEVSQ